MRTQRIHFVIFLIILVVIGAGCSRKKETAQPPPEPPKETVKEAPPKTPEEPKTVIPEAIYGIRTPPDAFGYLQYDEMATLLTKLSFDELRDFYKKHPGDFEVVDDKEKLFIIGLRKEMGSASFIPINRYGRPLRMVLSSHADGFKEVSVAQQQKEEIREVAAMPKFPLNPAKEWRGKPVLLKDSSGQLLAPGARWGEYYFPPEGSYFHKKEFEPNWGRPFGEWHPL